MYFWKMMSNFAKCLDIHYLVNVQRRCPGILLAQCYWLITFWHQFFLLASMTSILVLSSLSHTIIFHLCLWIAFIISLFCFSLHFWEFILKWFILKSHHFQETRSQALKFSSVHSSLINTKLSQPPKELLYVLILSPLLALFLFLFAEYTTLLWDLFFFSHPARNWVLYSRQSLQHVYYHLRMYLLWSEYLCSPPPNSYVET